MDTSAEASRHSPFATIARYLAEGIPGVLPIVGAPVASLVIDPVRSRLAIRVPATDDAPDVTDYENLYFDTVFEDNFVWHQVSVVVDQDSDEVYATLCSILDRVQLAGETFAQAVLAALGSLSGLVAKRRALTPERQVGLFGELLVLRALGDSVGTEVAVEAWRGPLGEEHDFGTENYDLEVKSTLGERREHWISSTTQLAPTRGRTLVLVSIQLTTSAVGSGYTLPALVKEVRTVFHRQLPTVDRVLGALGYREADCDIYTWAWTLRTDPAFYEVTPDFPALTQERLNGAVPSPDRVKEVKYRLDLTGLEALPPLLTFVYPAMPADSR